MSQDPNTVSYAAGWYPDTANLGTERYYDGAAWTEQTRPVTATPNRPIVGSPKMKRKWPWIVGGAVAGIILISSIANGVNGGSADVVADKSPVVETVKPDVAEVVATTVPDVVGITAKEARALIENAGLEVDYQANKGVVLDQDNWTVTGTTPEAGASLNTGDAVVVQVTKTAELNEGAAPTAPAEPAAPQYTLAQENALKSAQSYLDYSAFSRTGLIQQLSSEYGEGYPVDVATWAADTVGADWNAEAVESAKSYLDYSSFSRDGLYEQLTSEYGEGFTPEEANQALAAVGY